MLILAQLPSFHSLRHINMVSLVLCLAYSACATGGSIYIGKKHTQKRNITFRALFIIAQSFVKALITFPRKFIQGAKERLLREW